MHTRAPPPPPPPRGASKMAPAKARRTPCAPATMSARCPGRLHATLIGSATAQSRGSAAAQGRPPCQLKGRAGQGPHMLLRRPSTGHAPALSLLATKYRPPRTPGWGARLLACNASGAQQARSSRAPPIHWQARCAAHSGRSARLRCCRRSAPPRGRSPRRALHPASRRARPSSSSAGHLCRLGGLGSSSGAQAVRARVAAAWLRPLLPLLLRLLLRVGGWRVPRVRRMLRACVVRGLAAAGRWPLRLTPPLLLPEAVQCAEGALQQGFELRAGRGGREGRR